VGTRLGLRRAGAWRVWPRGRAAWKLSDDRASLRRGGGGRSAAAGCAASFRGMPQWKRRCPGKRDFQRQAK